MVSEIIWAERTSESLLSDGKPRRKGGPWESLGVDPTLARGLALRGFKNPTPIQRASIPHSTSPPYRDVLGMARTGSGKTLAYLIPLLQRLGIRHREARSMRALVLCPARELALQIYKAGKDLARSCPAADGEDRRHLEWALIIGGDALEKQFEAMTARPDIVIATPGRLLHLIIEMNLDLRTLEMVVYDEADRLFEMGFDTQLREILNHLPSSRQSLLFSATLPSSVTEFAQAGLTNPVFNRLDTEHKVSPDLSMTFFPVKPDEKDAALLVILDRALRIKNHGPNQRQSTQAIVFVSTKHHVEYLTTLLATAGFSVAHVYGSLHQLARQQQLESFRVGDKALLVVTDVAARGLDIPVMENVINYDFPTSSRVFVHRVGRTARAGHKGAAWSFVTRADMPHFLDLEAFLGVRIIGAEDLSFATIPQSMIDGQVEYVSSSLDEADAQLTALRRVMSKGQTMFERSRSKASKQACRDAKALGNRLERGTLVIPVYPALATDESCEIPGGRAHLLSSIQGYVPNETVLGIGHTRKHTSSALVIAKRRKVGERPAFQHLRQLDIAEQDYEDETSQRQPKSFHDTQFFMPHIQDGAEDVKAYSLQNSDASWRRIRAAGYDLSTDERVVERQQKPSQLKWNRKKKRFVHPANERTIRTESGARLPASYRTGRYESWRSAHQGGSSEEPRSMRVQPGLTRSASSDPLRYAATNASVPSSPKIIRRRVTLHTRAKTPSRILGRQKHELISADGLLKLRQREKMLPKNHR